MMKVVFKGVECDEFVIGLFFVFHWGKDCFLLEEVAKVYACMN